MLSVTIANISPSQNTPVLPNIRRIVMRPSGASCSRRNSAKLSLTTILDPRQVLSGLTLIHERQRSAALAFPDRAIEAGAAAGVTGSAGLLDLDPDRILVA